MRKAFTTKAYQKFDTKPLPPPIVLTPSHALHHAPFSGMGAISKMSKSGDLGQIIVGSMSVTPETKVTFVDASAGYVKLNM